MGVIIDTSGQIYAKLNQANTSLASLLGDAAILQAMGVGISSQISAAQKSIGETLAEIEAEIAVEEGSVAVIRAKVEAMAPQLAALYNLIVKAPATIGIDVLGVVTSKQTVPVTHGP